MKQINLKEAVVVGDQFDPADSPQRGFVRDAQVPRSLNDAGVGIIAEPAEERGDSIGIAQELNMLRA